MTKAALRREERERQAQQGTDQIIQQQHETQELPGSNRYGTIEQPPANTPHMEPPPPYDGPHLPRGGQDTHDRMLDDKTHPGCLNFGPGKAEGCLNYNSGRHGPEYKVYGCLNYDNQDGCLNYNSGERGQVSLCRTPISTRCCNEPTSPQQSYRYRQLKTDGCLNYDSFDGCLNYRSENGCLNWESKDGCCNYRSADGCMQWESEGGGCLNFRSRGGGCCQLNFR